MDTWDAGDAYDSFMDRWSERVAGEFVARLQTPAGLSWLDVGCGTGALLDAVRRGARPGRMTGVDSSAAFVETARARFGLAAQIQTADGTDLPYPDGSFDRVVSGLVLNFIPDPLRAVQEWRRVTRPRGAIGVYLWDYSGGMEFLRSFWDAAVAEDPEAAALDERARFPLCRPDRLAGLFGQAALSDIDVGHVDIPTRFRDFSDFWMPFSRGQGPAPSYVTSLAEEGRDRLRRRLESDLPRLADGSIELVARAWTTTGRV